MTKHVKKHLMLSTILFLVLVIFYVYSAVALPVYATENDVQKKTVSVLAEVIGLNMEDYASNLNSQLDNEFCSLAQKEVDFTLTSTEGSLRVKTSFVNNDLRQIYLSDFEGEFAVEYQSADTRNMAKDLLLRYQNYVWDSFYGNLSSMLNDVDVTKNTTKSAENIKLMVLNFNQTIVDYIWTYIDENGIVAKSKSVNLSYDKGQLKVFLNNWPLYKVVGTPKISGEEATEIALEAVKTYSYEISIDNVTSMVTGFDVAPESLGHETLSYLNFPDQSNARGGDPFTLYPSWYVPIGFNKSYPGAVTGIKVTIWADTGEISTTKSMVVSFPSNNSTDELSTTDGEKIIDSFNTDSTLFVLSIAIATMFSAFGISLAAGKKIHEFAVSKKLFPRLGGSLLCGILLFTVIIVSMPIVTANSTIPNSKSRIYAAYYSDPAQEQTEIDATNWLAGEIEDAFESSGYSADNLTGPSTNKTIIYNNAASDEDTYDRVAVFHFGHLYEFNTAYQDNNGDDVNSTELETYIETNKHEFVFIWVCTQAEDSSSGIPAAWTNRTDMASNGYLYPDEEDQCYIGFHGISPQIGNNSGTFQNQATGPVKNFIKSFYDYALLDSYSVRDSLNLASLDFFGYQFTSSIFYGYDDPDGYSYQAWFPGYKEPGDPDYLAPAYYNGSMRVFGDGSIWLFQPTITLSSNVGSPTFYLDGSAQSTGNVNVWPKSYSVSVSSIYGYTFDHFSYNGGNYGSNPSTLGLFYSGSLTAYYTPIPMYSLTISAGSGGTTSPSPNTYWFYSGTNMQVYANPQGGYVLDYWILDGNPVYQSSPITVSMTTNHNLQAVFKLDVPSFSVAVYAYDQYSFSLNVPVYIDGDYKGTTPYSTSLLQGYHVFSFDSPIYSYPYTFVCTSQNPQTIYVNSYTVVTATYYMSYG